MLPTSSIESVVFDEPSGNVRGSIIACMEINRKNKRIAHATLLVDQPADVTLSLGVRMSQAEAREAAVVIAAFCEELQCLDTQG